MRSPQTFGSIWDGDTCQTNCNINSMAQNLTGAQWINRAVLLPLINPPRNVQGVSEGVLINLVGWVVELGGTNQGSSGRIDQCG